MRDGEVLAGLGREAAPANAGATRQLFLAGRHAEIGGGAAHVVDVALEIGVLRHELGLGDQALVAAALDDAPLVEVERAERALAQTAAVAGEAELDLGDGGNAARGLVAGVIGPRVGQLVDSVQLLGGERRWRRVMDDVDPMRVLLHQRVAEEGVELTVLHAKAARVLGLVGLHLLEGGQDDGLVALLVAACAVDGALDEAEILHREAGVERLGDLDDGVLAHAVADDVGAGVQQDRALEAVGPIVVVGEAAQARLDAAEDDGRVLVGATDEVAIDHAGMVGAQAHLAAGGVEVL